MSNRQDQCQIYEMLSVLFLTLSKGQQAQQCIRQVLCSHPLFSPLPLFRYLTNNHTVLKKEHLLQFLEENREHVQDEEIKQIMEFEPGKKQWQYRDFLQFVYPFNSAVLREVTNMHLKRYPKLQKYSVPEPTLAGFLLLLTEQLSLIRKLQTQKSDSQVKLPKQKLRKVLLSIKKAGEKQPNHCENDHRKITSLELRNFMKAFVSVEDSHFLYLSRKLGIKNGVFMIEEIEKLIRPLKVKSKKGQKSGNKVAQISVMPEQQEEQQEQDFDQKTYKESLMEELAQQVSEKTTRGTSATGRTQVINYQQQYPNNQTLQQTQPLRSLNNTPPPKSRSPSKIVQDPPSHPHHPKLLSSSGNYFLESSSNTGRQISSPKQLLLNFIEAFLPASRRLQELKRKLSQHRLDYFKLFKVIDRSGRGVVGAQDLIDYYRWAGGRMHFDSRDFQLLIERYAQSDEPWITLTEFCEMVRTDDKESATRNPSVIGEEMHSLVIRIMEVSLESQRQLLAIRNLFKKNQSKYLFNLINREQTGFINYQQLKKYLSQAGLSLSMYDLMALLKRLDRSRNGVVVEHEFVEYFRPPQTLLY